MTNLRDKAHFGIAALGLLALIGAPALAHEIRPAVTTAVFTADGRYQVQIVANLEAVLAGVSPKHSDTDESPNAQSYKQLRAAPAETMTARVEAFAPTFLAGVQVWFDDERVAPRLVAIEVPPPGDVAVSRLSTIRLAGVVPAGARTFRFAYAAEFGSSVLRVQRASDADIAASWLQDGAMSAPFALTGSVAPTSRVDVAKQYAVLGFTHILPKGLDHILFVLGLFLLSVRLKPLLWQVTAFTVAHSITLGLSIYGVVSLSPAIVEPLIAASIVYVALENTLTNELKPWRPAVVFGFGLLHGLGFAGILTEVGLPRSEFVTGLIAFNVGVELGQLAVICAAYLAVGVWAGHSNWYRARVVVPASLAIAAVGLYWTVERLVA